jgi:hypothetical protein
LREQCLHLVSKDLAVEVREFCAATKRTKLLHEKAWARWIGALPFGLRAIDQPDIPRVHLSVAAFQSHRFRKQIPKSPRWIPVVPDLSIVQQLRGWRDVFRLSRRMKYRNVDYERLQTRILRTAEQRAVQII